MSAQKRLSRRLITKTKIGPSKFVKIILFGLIVIVILGITKFVVRTKYWKDDNRLVVAIAQEDGNVLVSSIDPINKEIVNLIIPGNTEVEVAGNLGRWKLGKVWDLGVHENREGELLASTITSHFGIPVATWGDDSIEGLVAGGVANTFRSIFYANSNLTFGDRLKIGFFALTIDNVRRADLILAETSFFKQKTLSDGSGGYEFVGDFSPKIYSFFTDYYFKDRPSRVVVIGTDKNENKAKMIAKVVETLGGKIVSMSKQDDENDYKCNVAPKDDKRSLVISEIFDCNLVETGGEENFDLVIKIGNKFQLFY